MFSFDPTRDNQAICLFNGTAVPASVVSDSSVECVAPPTVSGGGVSLVRVSVNGVDVADASSVSMDEPRRGGMLRFIYLPDEEEMSLFPASGPVKGGTTVVVRGRHIAAAAEAFFVAQVDGYSQHGTEMSVLGENNSLPLLLPPSSAMCSFGDEPPVQASGLSFHWDGMLDAGGRETGVGQVVCVSPPAADGSPHAVAVEVSLNVGRDFTKGGPQFYYRPEAYISSLEPAYGPVSGGTPVRVEGGPFRDEGSGVAEEQLVRCRFGDQETGATVHSESLVACRAPAMPSVPEQQDIEVWQCRVILCLVHQFRCCRHLTRAGRHASVPSRWAVRVF